MSKIGFGGKNLIDIIKYRYVWFGISALLLLPCIVFMIYSMMTLPTHSPVRLGIDFTGGTFLQYGFSQKLEVKDIGAIRKVLAKVEQENAIIQIQEPTEILGNLSDVNAGVNDKKKKEVKEDKTENEATSKDEKTSEEDATKSDETDSKTVKDETKPETVDEKASESEDVKDSKTEKTFESKANTPEETKDSKAETTLDQKETKPEEATDTKTEETVEEKTEEAIIADVNKKDTNTGEEVVTEETLTETPEKDVKTIVSMRVKFLNDKELKELNSVLKNAYGDFSILQVSAIGPSLGKELLYNAMMALLLVFGGIVVYLSFRFQIDYAVCALITLFHDAIFVIGLFALFGILFKTEVDSLFVTAVLTVIGFSVHDTIVVFDRIRENARFLSKKKSFNEICNDSVNQTLARSINTSLTTIFVLLCLYIFGGVTTKDFVLAMTLGIAIGTYSSIFVASVILAFWRDINAPKKRTRKVTT